ncbi:biotin transporter BioY [Natroniella acetigena]|uniref:biotin transporter BioY n=1 Tax=Natroniella acetigena TaxID=52004 RepID=UPI00200B39B7|nr:biotin transporter BioY [Natroniella acetigena]MCK8826201.1 biotin transporter BioY [Natroniella acetigena]
MKNSKLTIQDLTYSALFAALLASVAYLVIPLPFSPTPITLQTLVVMLAGAILSTKQAGLSILIFLLIGFSGAPVFSGGSAGIGVLAEPTGGYLVAYPLGAILINLLAKKDSYYQTALAMVLGGVVVIHLFGVIWMSFVTEMNLTEAVIAGSLPFIPGDLIKAAVATPLSRKINNHLAARK